MKVKNGVPFKKKLALASITRLVFRFEIFQPDLLKSFTVSEEKKKKKFSYIYVTLISVKPTLAK